MGIKYKLSILLVVFGFFGVLFKVSQSEAQNSKSQFVPVNGKAQTNYGNYVVQDAPTGYWRLSNDPPANETDLGSGLHNATYTFDNGPTKCSTDTNSISGGCQIGDAGGRDKKAVSATSNFNLDAAKVQNFYTVAAYTDCINSACEGIERIYCYKVGDFNPPSANFSVEGWFKSAASLADNTSQYIVSKWDGAANTGYYLRLNDASGGGDIADSIQFAIGNGGSMQTVTSATTVVVGTWYHVVGTLSGTTMTMYVNAVEPGTAGALSNTAAFAGTPSAGTATLMMASGASATTCNKNGNFNGEVRDVAVYALTLTYPRTKLHYNTAKGF